MTAATPQAEPLSDLDRQALDLAITIDRERNKACRQQIDDKLRTEPWLRWPSLPPSAVRKSRCISTRGSAGRRAPFRSMKRMLRVTSIAASANRQRCCGGCWRLASASMSRTRSTRSRVSRPRARTDKNPRDHDGRQAIAGECPSN